MGSRFFLNIFFVSLVMEESHLIRYFSEALFLNTTTKFDFLYLDDFGFNFTQDQQMIFAVKAANDAHIALARTKRDLSLYCYEVVLGGWSNTRSVIRNCVQCKPKVQIDGKFLNETEFVTFWLAWEQDSHNNTTAINAGLGSVIGEDTFLNWTDTDGHAINYIGISTGWNASGIWTFDVVDGGWSSWQDWSECNATCGQGSRVRMRQCNNPEPRYGRTCDQPSVDLETCLLSPCPINGGWSSWSSWSVCTTTCGPGEAVRNRACDSPPAQYGGDVCEGDSQQTKQCQIIICPIDGSWSQWGEWGTCSLSCGEGTRLRSRVCDNPEPAHGGKKCEGDNSDMKPCLEVPCPIDGSWTDWTSWSRCSTSCDLGRRNKTRSCENPIPQYGGKNCSGDFIQYENCTVRPCPVNGTWSSWQSWNECSVTCGVGFQQRMRTCDNPPPQHGGATCAGSKQERQDCGNVSCPVDGAWSSWAPWSTCSATCDGGEQYRLRSCSSPPPQHGGTECRGTNRDEHPCNTANCPIDGDWSPWSVWGECTLSCSGGVQSRYRVCDNPEPMYGGDTCQGFTLENQTCNSHPCPVNGGWSSWLMWSTCSHSCGLGVKTRQRYCDNPSPQHGGLACVGNSNSTSPCQLRSCPVNGNWAIWGAWGPCSVTCDLGTQVRMRNCSAPSPAHGGLPCEGRNETERGCNDALCPVNGSWSPWNHWAECSVTCGRGNLTRKRTCTNPQPLYGGYQCPGSELEVKSCAFVECASEKENAQAAADVVEAPGARVVGVIGVGMIISLAATVVILDLATINRHITFMKRNICHWMHKNGWVEEDPHSRNKSRKKSSRRSHRKSHGRTVHESQLRLVEECEHTLDNASSPIPSSNHPDVSFMRPDTGKLRGSSPSETHRPARLPRITLEQNILSPSDLDIHVMQDETSLHSASFDSYNIRDYGPFSNLEVNMNRGEWKHSDGYDKNITDSCPLEQTATKF